jgi:hypothetical protein
MRKPKAPTKPVEGSGKADDCVVPPALPKGDLHKLMFRYSEQEATEIAGYVEWQARGEETVLHAEKVASERVMGHDHDVWDVHTDKARWWVITNPMNLYSQELMPSLDYTLSFHIGLMARVAARRELSGSEAERELVLVTSRKLLQAGEALDEADEAEEFQSVGMRCRECLLSFVRELGDTVDVAASTPLPKAGDFLAWNDLICNAVAPGPAREYVRGYLKTTGEKAWRLVNWLTHSSKATREDAQLAWGATEHVVSNLTRAALLTKAGSPARCGRCRSFRIHVDWRPDLGETGLYVARCEACGAERLPEDVTPVQ